MPSELNFLDFLEEPLIEVGPKSKNSTHFITKPDSDPESKGRWLLSWKDSDRENWMKILDQVKSIPHRVWSPMFRCWSIPGDPETLNLAKEIGFTFESVPTATAIRPYQPPEPLVDPKAKLLDDMAKIELVSSKVVSGLREYQLDFLRFMLLRGGRGGLGDDMGTGKTIQALAWAIYASAYPCLIVVPATVKIQWLRQWLKWIPAESGVRNSIEILDGRTPRLLDKTHSYIINWDILADWTGALANNKQFITCGPLAQVPFKLLVGDEIQAIGNPTSKRSKAFRALGRIIPGFIGMSGTPVRSRPAQFWPLLNMLDARQFGNNFYFLNRYCEPKGTGFGMSYNGATHIQELHALITPLILRRMKSEVLKDLPPLSVDVVPMNVDESAMKQYQRDATDVFTGEMTKQERRDRVAGLLRTAYTLKEESSIQWIKDWLDNGSNKLVVYCWYRDVVDLVMDSLKSYHPVQINGGITGKHRDDKVQQFVGNSNCRVMVANIQAGGVGLDGLQAVCSDCVFLEFSYTPTDHAQAVDRFHRSGQIDSVNAYYLVAPGTVDEDAIDVLDSRRKMIDSVLDGTETGVERDLLTEILARRGL